METHTTMNATLETILELISLGALVIVIGAILAILFLLARNKKQLQRKSMEAEKIENMLKNGKITQEEAAELKKAIGFKAFLPGMKTEDKHIKILSLLEIIIFALGLLMSVIVFLFLFSLDYIQKTAPDFGIENIIPASIIILSILGLFIVLRLWAAFKIRKGSKAARITILIFSIVDLLSFPIGTAVGIYAFWVLLFRKGAEEYYNALAE